MAELSQSDLDALFADLGTPEAPQPALEQAKAHEPAPQPDLDKLMADLEALCVNTTPEPQQAAPVSSLPDNESLSQDQIDALLKEFLG